MTLFSSLVLVGLLAQTGTPPPPAQPNKKAPAPQTATPAPQPTTPATQPAGKKAPGVSDGLAMQVALDRAGYSPGAIDGQPGSNTKKALEAYRKANGGDPQTGEATTTYQITEQDAAGPFEANIPRELPDQGKLPALSYKNIQELLAEKFHTTPEFLKKLNPSAKFTAGEQITVPNVEPMQAPTGGSSSADAKQKPGAKPADAKQNAQAQKPDAKPNAQAQKPDAARGTTGRANQPAATAPAEVVVTVTKSTSALTVTDPSGKVLMYAPVTTGSTKDPLPLGEWKVNGVTINPPFRYNPDLFWDADPSHSKTLIKPGPNNPVGVVWIDLSKEHYGIHGTPEPSTVGKTQSHGCVRLTNWDALKLAALVKPGTKVVFRQ